MRRKQLVRRFSAVNDTVSVAVGERFPVTLLWVLLNKMRPQFFARWPDFRPVRRPLWWQPIVAMFFVVLLCWLCYGAAFLMNPMPVVFITGTILGIIGASGTAASINGMRQRGYFDLLSLSPLGVMGVSWGMAAHFARTNPLFMMMRQLLLTVQMFVLILFIGMALVFGIELASAFYTGEAGRLLDDILFPVNLFFFFVLIRFDYQYACVLGALAGVIAPTMTSRNVESSLAAVALLVFAQIVSYSVLAIFSLPLLALFGDNGLFSSLITIVSYIVVREAAVMGVWHLAQLQLNTSFDELREFGKYYV